MVLIFCLSELLTRPDIVFTMYFMDASKNSINPRHDS